MSVLQLEAMIDPTDEAVVRTIPAVLGLGAGLAVLQGVFTYTGGTFSGYNKGPSVDEFDRKEQLRKNRRRPIQETLDELGEGRGTERLTSSNGPFIVDIIRDLWPRLRGTTAGENQEKLWDRCTSRVLTKGSFADLTLLFPCVIKFMGLEYLLHFLSTYYKFLPKRCVDPVCLRRPR